MSNKLYFVATQVFLDFLEEIEGKRAKLASASGMSSRTIARIKGKGRTSSGSARDLHRAAVSGFGFSGAFDQAFEQER